MSSFYFWFSFGKRIAVGLEVVFGSSRRSVAEFSCERVFSVEIVRFASFGVSSRKWVSRIFI